MILPIKAGGLLSGVSACVLSFGATAQANDLPAGAAARAQARCETAYGPGFVGLEGGDACVFVGGHVRVEFGKRGFDSPDNGWASGGAVRVNAAPSDGSVDHLRLRDSSAPGSIAR